MKKTISAELFRQYVQQDELLFVEFHAPWCGYCRRIAPAVSRLEQRYGRQLQMVQINIDDEPALTDAERIFRLPRIRSAPCRDLLLSEDNSQGRRCVGKHFFCNRKKAARAVRCIGSCSVIAAAGGEQEHAQRQENQPKCLFHCGVLLYSLQS